MCLPYISPRQNDHIVLMTDFKKVIDESIGSLIKISLHYLDFLELCGLGCPNTHKEFSDKYACEVEIVGNHSFIKPGYPLVYLCNRDATLSL